MLKRVCIIFIIWLSLVLPCPVLGALHYYSGTMDSSIEMTNLFYISVPSGVTSLTFLLTLPENYSLPNNLQELNDLNFSFSIDPSKIDDYTDDYKNHYKKFTWADPQEGTIKVAVTYSVSSGSDWNKFVTSDKYPFNSAGLPESVTDFLQPSDMVQSDDPIFINKANMLTNGFVTQWEAMTAINGWIIDNINYDSYPLQYDALYTYDNGGNCSNYAHIALALVRAAGIPARVAHGYSLRKAYELPTDGDPVVANWGAGTHAWIEVYYPSLGWVSYDPQRDFHHVDTHRILIGRGIDITGIMGKVSATTSFPQEEFTPDAVQAYKVNRFDDSINLSYIKTTDEVQRIYPDSFSAAVTFLPKHTIIATSTGHGSISPAGQVFTDTGSSHTFSITPDPGYYVADVLVDGNPIQQAFPSSYTFDNVSSDHTITAEFLIEDSDGDGLPDWWEQHIIDYYSVDGINAFEDVLPAADFDGDNFANLEEYLEDTNPTDKASHPPRPMPWLLLLLED